jgi:tripeptide aminopeptidase
MDSPSLLDRFCRYVRVDTTADDRSSAAPSSPGQLVLGKMLVQELREMGVSDAAAGEHGLVTATVPASPGAPADAPVVAFLAHMDTSPEAPGKDVRPVVHRDYRGRDIVLPGDPSKVLRPADSPDLKRLVGGTVVTSDGTTLLGGDDKAGVAILMEIAAHLLANPKVVHGPVRLLFTCDEEIGRGADHVDLEKLGAHVAYTLDGEGQGEIDCETFSADMAIVTFAGVNTHPGWAKGKMVNAVRMAGEFLARLPRDTLSPETTAGREGFLHPNGLEGGVTGVTLRLLLRDFRTETLADHAARLHGIARAVEGTFPGGRVEVAVRPQYRNMAEGLAREPRAVEFAEAAMRRVGLEPKLSIIRGGTDGSRLTEMGLPTPNLSSGQHNLHSLLEWVGLEEMAAAVRVSVELAQLWASSGRLP